MADSTINGLSSGTTPLAGTEELPIWQSSDTVKVTTQDIADLVSASNIGNSDLTIDSSGTRKLIMGGALSTDRFIIRNSADTQDFFEVRGNGVQYMDDQLFLGQQKNASLALNVYGNNNSSSPIAGFYNSAGTTVFEFRQASNHGQLYIRDSSGNIALNFRGNTGITFLDGINIIAGTSTGTKIGTGTTQKLGFWNSTPIAQPSSTGETTGFTAGTGTGVNDDSTFTGNVGSTAYRISDIVKHLKNAGLIAS